MEGLAGKGKAMRSTEASSAFGSQGRCQTAIPATNASATTPAAIAGRRNLFHLPRSEPHPEDPDWIGDVLDLLRSQVLEDQVELGLDTLVDDVGDANPTRFGQSLQSRSDVDAVTVNVLTVNNDVAEVDADPELEAAVFG